jgi:hypothetical protein
MKSRMKCFAVVALCLCFDLPSSSWAHEGPPYDRIDYKIKHAAEDAYDTAKTAVSWVGEQVVEETISYYEWLDSGMQYVADVYFPDWGSASDHPPTAPAPPNPLELQCSSGALSPDHPACQSSGLSF